MGKSFKEMIVRVLNWHIDLYNAGPKGRLKILGLWVGVMLVFALAGQKPMTSIETSDGVAVINMQVMSWEAADGLATRMLGEVYELAQSNPDLQKVRVSFTMSKGGLSDQYGNPVKEDFHMGDLTWDSEDLQEARKYRERALYSVNEMRNALYVHHIKGMNGGHLLRD